MSKRLAPLRAKNDVTNAFQLKLLEPMNKKQILSACDVISPLQKCSRRNKKNQEKANNTPIYRCAPNDNVKKIKNVQICFKKAVNNEVKTLITIPLPLETMQ